MMACNNDLPFRSVYLVVRFCCYRGKHDIVGNTGFPSRKVMSWMVFFVLVPCVIPLLSVVFYTLLVLVLTLHSVIHNFRPFQSLGNPHKKKTPPYQQNNYFDHQRMLQYCEKFIILSTPENLLQNFF